MRTPQLRTNRRASAGRRACRPALALLVSGLLALLAAASAQEDTFPHGIQGIVDLAPAKGVVGSQATISGQGFKAGTTLDVVWTAFDGSWKLEMQDGEYTGNFLGRDFTSRDVTLTTADVADDGTFSADFTVPEGFGGTHDIYLRDGSDNLNKAGYFVEMNAEMTPENGPLGTDITVHVTGIDSINNVAGWYALMYDNAITGFVTAMETHGSATVVIPAAGREGKHLVQLRNAPFDAPYLALASSPYGYLPEPQFTFTVTGGDPVLPAPLGEQDSDPVAGTEPTGTGPKLWVDPVDAPVGTPSVIHGRGFEPGQALDLAYTNMAGSRVTAAGYGATMVKVDSATAGDDGAFDLSFDVPDVLGGEHRLEARAGGENGDVVASTHFTIAPHAIGLDPAQGPFGTPITLHMKGIGWTQTNNIFAVVVDNVFFGYACGFSTNGDVVVPMTASWAPGVHYIDLYPSFYRNKDYSQADEQPFLYRQAVLTWQDHPNKLHYRFAYTVTQ